MCSRGGSLFAAAALGRGGALADAALRALGTSRRAAGAAACGGGEKNKSGTFPGGVSGWGLGGLPGGGWFGDLPPTPVSSPFSSIPIPCGVSQGVFAPRAGTGEAAGGCGTPRGSPSRPPSPALGKPSRTRLCPGGDAIRSSRKKSRCPFPPGASPCAEGTLNFGFYRVARIAWWRGRSRGGKFTLSPFGGEKIQEE